MKANELMVGDWVLFNKDKIQIDLYLYHREWNMEEDFDTIFRLFKPIPLTTEILEMNGWSKEEIPSEYQCGVDVEYTSPDGRVIVRHFDTNSKEWGVHLDNDHFSTIGYFECDYVHELQHALRLCELNELADNFKV